MFKIVRLEQNSAAWRQWRFEGIGASDAATAIGVNRFRARDDLLAEKSGPHAQPPLNAAMRAGLEDEPIAALAYHKRAGVLTEPTCIQHLGYEWLRASLDGLHYGQRHVVEIKCGQRNYEWFQGRHSIPPWHKPQLQHILAITGYDEIRIWCWSRGERGLMRSMKRDEKYIERLIDLEQVFWFDVQAERKRRKETLNIHRQPPV